ncbi:MAG: hypothetical protein H7293_08380 [Candidatus Saccharibacteria bacterium]|nr:hypothetical protein [Rhodoferax sp.]
MVALGDPLDLFAFDEITRILKRNIGVAAVPESRKLLTRSEPQLGIAPDLWAIRGNASQRLDRLQDSVHAYMAPLQSRHNEQRWLLRAAVPLAALGQISSAGEMAEKARMVGVVSPDVLAYLRQMGVSLRDK